MVELKWRQNALEYYILESLIFRWMNFCPQILPATDHTMQLHISSPAGSEVRQDPCILTATCIYTQEPEVSKQALSLGLNPTFLHVKAPSDFNVSSMHVRPAGLAPVGV